MKELDTAKPDGFNAKKRISKSFLINIPGEKDHTKKGTTVMLIFIGLNTAGTFQLNTCHFLLASCPVTGHARFKLYIKNARECLTMISKHEKAYEARGAKPQELYIAFECFDIIGKH